MRPIMARALAIAALLLTLATASAAPSALAGSGDSGSGPGGVTFTLPTADGATCIWYTFVSATDGTVSVFVARLGDDGNSIVSNIYPNKKTGPSGCEQIPGPPGPV